MISMLIGTIAGQERDDRLVVNCNGVGYSVAIGKRDRKACEQHGKLVHVYCRQTWAENGASALFGWLTESDRALFDTLLHLDGVGPGRAAKIVDVVDEDELRALCAQGVKAVSKRIDGVGPKLAASLVAKWGDHAQAAA
jgi:Holliday junction DNA helicase RuvA